nr:MAG TPA: zinc-ribbon domain protein [Caudoviricetes sp.]
MIWLRSSKGIEPWRNLRLLLLHLKGDICMQHMSIKCHHCGTIPHLSQKRTLKLFLKLISQEPIWIF